MIPLACALGAWCLGILLAGAVHWTAIAFSLSGLGLWYRSRTRLQPPLRHGLLVAALVPLSMAWAAYRTPVPGPDDLSRLAPMRWVMVTGRVASDPIAGAKGCRFEFEADKLVAPFERPCSGRVAVHLLTGDMPHYDEPVRLEGAINPPPEAMNPGEFSYRSYLQRKGIFVTLAARGIKPLGPAPWTVQGVAIALKAACLTQIAHHMPTKTAALMGSLLLGNGVSPVDPDVADQFRDLGLAHVLAVSGAQVLIILSALKRLFKVLRIRRRYGMLIAGGIVILYGMMTGMPPSIARAILMAMASLLAWGARRRSRKLVPLLAASWLMLLYCPAWLYDLGFLFSVIATFALQHTTPILTERMKAWPGWLSQNFGTSVAATLWVTPLQLASFGQISAWTLPANLLACLFVEFLTLYGAVLVPVGAIAEALHLDGPWIQPGYILAGWLLDLFDWGVATLHRLPGASLHVVPLDWTAAAGLYALLWVGLTQLRRERWWRLAGCAVAAGLILSLPTMLRPRELMVTVLSVGQGDSIVFRTPGNRWYLVDAGPDWDGGDAGSRTIVPYLQRQGVQRLSGVILTHPHADHIGGMVSVLQAIPADAVWDGGQDWHEPRYLRFFRTLLAQRVPWSVVRAGSEAQLEPGLWLDVLGPPSTPYRGTHSDCNNNSVVVRLRYGTFSMLLAGDLEHDAELGLVRDRPRELQATVLKVSHHGSRFGSNPEFLAAVRPRACLISVGAHNLFHHPSPEAIARLGRYGPVYRTDRDGALTVRTDGRRWTLETIAPPGTRL